jgi:ribosomal-protein-alanine N-acetyltransferase
MKEPAVSLRPATSDDLPRIVAIEAQVQKAPWSFDSFQAEFVKPFSSFWVLTDDETDEQVHGYIVFWILDGECRILTVAVGVESRGMGYGKRLLRAALQEGARSNARKAVLEVRRSNNPAIQLYQSLGFMIQRIQKAFYSNGEDAYVMEVSLEADSEEI